MDSLSFQPFTLLRLLFQCGVLACLLLASLVACTKDEDTPPDKVVLWNTGGDAATVYRAKIHYGGIPQVDILQGLGQSTLAYGAAMDPKSDKIYIFSNDSLLRQASYDLKEVKTVGYIAGEKNGFSQGSLYGQIGDVVFANNQIYWSQTGNAGSRIARVNPDGSTKKVLYTAAVNSDTIGVKGLTQPQGSPDLYWGTDKKIWRGKADGNGLPTLVYDLSADSTWGTLNDLAVWKENVYLATDKGIWAGTTNGSGKLSRLFATETEKAKVISSISIDPEKGQLYWFCTNPTAISGQDFQFLYRGNPDGTASKKLLERQEGQQLQVD